MSCALMPSSMTMATMHKRKKWLADLTAFAWDASGNVGLIAAIALPGLVAVSVVAVEMSHSSSMQAKLQTLADSAAVGAAREMRLGNAKDTTILGVAQNIVAAGASNQNINYNFSGSVGADKRTITVNLNSDASAGLGVAAGLAKSAISVTATARIMGGAPVCAVALNEKDPSTFDLEKLARVEAPKCAVYSNSKSVNGLEARDSATLTSAFTCSAGGFKSGGGTFSPTPDIDCPNFPDPLASRPPPVVGACEASKEKKYIAGIDTFLTPGTYCGGLTIDKNAQVTLQPGIYVFKDGPLVIGGGSRLVGTDIGLFFTGINAGMDMKKNSSLSLSAPRTGDMTGLLIYQDRATIVDNEKFEVSSDDASNLLGTIYLPRGRLYVGGDKPVAQKSAYTIIVANKIQMSAGPTLVLNSDYSASTVPVPQGVGPLSSEIALQR